MFRLATNLALKSASIYRYHPQVHYASRAMGTLSKKRSTNLKYKTAYSKVTMREAEKRLGFRFAEFEKHDISVSQMLAESKPEIEGLRKDQVQETKDKVFHGIVDFIEAEGYPTQSDEDFKEANINDLVFTILVPIIAAFRRNTGRKLLLQREKQITAVDLETGGYEEFVMVDLIGVENQKFVFLVEAKRSSLGEAKRQCLLAMKDIGENNGVGVVYGFVTTGEQWQMIRYDGTVFTQTRRFLALFGDMGQEKETWMKESSIIVDCIHEALRSGGFVVDN
ncbi:hypothetical protein L873DRAFT_1415496 [Choiromyces venosus 120613-1]|uniref:Uncharacterized protein n=1 Tax=Choiromyces venosus 120613-1 TaxID=1336337 RepID=A0A3N4J8S2_9PEZI|nr:hypothetical protein L873DRAFT_1415496 [Choiromyces venosus 120613-1]